MNIHNWRDLVAAVNRKKKGFSGSEMSARYGKVYAIQVPKESCAARP
jgi:hypothetical protein